MTFESLLTTYGYPALFVGTFLEGETILVIAGFAAHRGYLSLPWVIVVAFLGTFVSDQLWFMIGRKKGRAFSEKRASWKGRIERVQGMIKRHEWAVVLGFRFLYGIRNVTPFVIGMSGFSVPRFMALNATGGLLWAVVVGTTGYLFGHSMEIILDDVRRYERTVIASLALVGLAVWGWFRVRRRAQISTRDEIRQG